MLRHLADGRRISVTAAVGGVILLVSGCAGNAPAPDDGRGAGKAPVLRSSADLRLPIQDYLFSDAELGTVKQAMRTLAQECMRRFKVSHEFAPPAAPLGPRSLMDRRYGLTDQRLAGAFGYHLGERDPRTHPVAEPSPPVGKALTVLSGSGGSEKVNGMRVPARGCAGEAERKIAGSGGLGPVDLAQDLNGKSFHDTRADRRVAEVFGAWSGCMEDKGFSYPDPLAAMNDRRFQGKRPVPEEIRVAVADVDCKARTDVVGVWFKVETAYQKSLIAKHRKALNAALAQKNRQLAAARAVDSGG
ncbi:hypothetical protein ADL00_21595 [Streptomyces sp. AS58]|nr:hypothetical protein ADL00_21595 [Streptomyces sp. AS58]